MKRLFVFAALALLASCNSNDSKVASMKSPGTDTTTQADVTYPFTINYSSKFEIGSNEQSKKLLTIWKDYDNGDLTAHKDYFADTVELHFWDGSVVKGQRDTVLNGGNTFRATLASVRSEVDAVLPVKSIDKGQNWVTVWGTEYDTDKKGKVDSFYLQETWRQDSAGKFDFMMQYQRKATAPKM